MRLVHLIMVMQLKAAQCQTIDRQVAKLRETRQHCKSAEEHMEHAVKELAELQTKTMLAAVVRERRQQHLSRSRPRHARSPWHRRRRRLWQFKIPRLFKTPQ